MALATVIANQEYRFAIFYHIFTFTQYVKIRQSFRAVLSISFGYFHHIFLSIEKDKTKFDAVLRTALAALRG